MPLTYQHPAPMLTKDPMQSLLQRIALFCFNSNYAVSPDNGREVVWFAAFDDAHAAFIAQRIATFERYTNDNWEDFTVYRNQASGFAVTEIARGYASKGWLRLNGGAVRFYAVMPHRHTTNGVITTHKWFAHLAKFLWGQRLLWRWMTFKGNLDRMQLITYVTDTLDRNYVNMQIGRARYAMEGLAAATVQER